MNISDIQPPLTPREKVAAGCALLWLMLGALIVGAFCGGCAERGVKVTSSAASMKNIGDINWEEYKIPVLSIVHGPRTTVWINKDYLALKRLEATGAITNAVAALGIYTDNGSGSDRVAMEFYNVSTNRVKAATD